MGRCAGAPKKERNGEEGNDVTRAEVRGKAQQNSDKHLSLHLLQLRRFRWEPRDANETRGAEPVPDHGPGVCPSLCRQPGRPIGPPEHRPRLCTSHPRRRV